MNNADMDRSVFTILFILLIITNMICMIINLVNKNYGVFALNVFATIALVICLLQEG